MTSLLSTAARLAPVAPTARCGGPAEERCPLHGADHTCPRLEAGPADARAYTAKQIAAAQGITARAVKLSLQANPDARPVRLPSGQQAKGWPLAGLPCDLLRELEAVRQARGRRTLDDLLQDPPQRWQAPVPWADLAPQAEARATRSRDAFAGILQRQHQLGAEDRIQQASVFYRQQFRTDPPGEDRLRYILDRATERDRGFGEWHRPELYLDEADFRSDPAAAQAPTGQFEHLVEAVAALDNKVQPTLADRRHLLHAAFQDFESQRGPTLARGPQRELRQRLCRQLYQAVPGLYRAQAGAGDDPRKPLKAVRQLFVRQYPEWAAGSRTPDAIKDDRKGRAGRKGYQCPACEKQIRDLALILRGVRARRGNVDLAIKTLREKGNLCPACLAHWQGGKTAATLRERVTPNAIQIAVLKGPKALQQVAPTHHSDWSDTRPGDRFVIDDMTTNEIAWDEVNGEFIHGQVQLLYTEDEFSSYPLPFWMYFGAPNSRAIKKALWEVLTKVGLPRDGLLTERGVFANRTVAGERGVKNWLPLRELKARLEGYFTIQALADEDLKEVRSRELGLLDPALGIHIHQARTPMAKPVERTFFEIQKSTSRLEGFGGFSQRLEKPDWLAVTNIPSAKLSQSQRDEIKEKCLHISDLARNYEQICQEFAHRPVNGIRHRGRTPLDVWEEDVVRRHPLEKLPPEMEAWFAHRRIPNLTVHSNGLHLDLDRFEPAFYCNEHTGRLLHRKVTVFFNPDIPEHIHLEHPDTGLILKVERILTKRRTATPEEMAKVGAARRDHIAGARGEMGNVKALRTAYTIRDNAHNETDKETGRILQDSATQAKAKARQEKSAVAELQRRAERLGWSLPADLAQNPRLQLQAERELDQMEKSQEQAQPAAP